MDFWPVKLLGYHSIR